MMVGAGGSSNPGGGSSAGGTNPGGGMNAGGTNPGGGMNAGGASGGMDAGGAGGAAAGAGGISNATFANYNFTGSWPQIPMAIATVPAALTYQKIKVHGQFLAESCSIADYDNDGVPDISSGRRWYNGPDFTTEHIFRGGHEVLPALGTDGAEINTGVSDDWACYPWDVNGDGFADIINIANCDVPADANVNPAPEPQAPGTAVIYENPGTGLDAAMQDWAARPLHGDVRHEMKGLVDVNGDGQPELFGACKLCDPNFTKGYYQLADWTQSQAAWSYNPVVFGVDFPFNGTGWMHGLGFGDVSGDGKPDLITRNGVFTQPEAAGDWAHTDVQLFDGANGGERGGGHMFSADFDGDGDMDIFSARGAHHWGLSWYEQTGPMTFTEHQFMGQNNEVGNYPNNNGISFSEPHSAQLADMDGDGVMDVITGKMRFAHPIPYNDPDPLGACTVEGSGDGCNYLVVFRGVRDTPGTSGAFHFEAHLVDAEAGVGRQLTVGHANTDGKMDICVASKLGLFVFLGQ